MQKDGNLSNGNAGTLLFVGKNHLYFLKNTYTINRLTESNEMKFQCMNWGYFDENDDPSKYEDTEEKYCLRLYDEVVNGTDLKGKVIADVSCGRGSTSKKLLFIL